MAFTRFALTTLAFPVAIRTYLPSSLHQRAACDSDVMRLVAGINKNIDIQKQEQALLKVVMKIVDADDVDQEDFDSAQTKFVSIANKRIDQRKANQGLLPDGHRAADGLQTRAEQGVEAIQSLTGNVSTDDKTCFSWSDMFSGGIAQNQKSAQAVNHDRPPTSFSAKSPISVCRRPRDAQSTIEMDGTMMLADRIFGGG